MSYQAHVFVCNLRGCSRGEKALLHVLARYHDSRTGICRVSQARIAADAEMSKRHTVTLCKGLEGRQVIERMREHMGRGGITLWRLVGMGKDEANSSFSTGEKVNSMVKKGEIRSEKGEAASPPNKERKKDKRSKVLSKPHPNPPFQGGNPVSGFRLKRRDHTRISRWIEKNDRPNDLGVGKLAGVYVLARATHLAHLRFAEYAMLIAAADISGHYGVGVLLESVLADKLAFLERTRRLVRHIIEGKIAERLAA